MCNVKHGFACTLHFFKGPIFIGSKIIKILSVSCCTHLKSEVKNYRHLISYRRQAWVKITVHPLITWIVTSFLSTGCSRCRCRNWGLFNTVEIRRQPEHSLASMYQCCVPILLAENTNDCPWQSWLKLWQVPFTDYFSCWS